MPSPPETQPASGASITLSVIINNFNYASYLPETLESLLIQGDEIAEIIVVDDCSTDASRAIISDYADKYTGRIRPVFQEINQGQGAAFNAGYAISRGDLVMFLDADDFMLPGAAAQIRANYEPDVTVYQYRMRYTNETSALGDGLYPPLSQRLADGMEASEALRSTGRYPTTITSGLVFNRWVLDRIMPMDGEAFRYGGDGYVVAAAPLYGPVRSFETEICAYRLHERQHTSRREAQAKLARWRLSHDAERYKVVRYHAARLGLPVADDLGAKDEGNLFERIVSMVFDPASHPVEGDRLADLIRDLRRLEGASRTGGQRAASGLFWTVMLYAPGSVRIQMMRLKLDPAARPAWLKRTARFVRRRFKL
ncbi:MAG: glycosyltransferase family 2 protein [Hyphomonas sp.]